MSFHVLNKYCRAAREPAGIYEPTGRDLETGIYGRISLANTSERLRQLAQRKLFNDQRLINRDCLNSGLVYTEGIFWIKVLYSFLSNSSWRTVLQISCFYDW